MVAGARGFSGRFGGKICEESAIPYCTAVLLYWWGISLGGFFLCGTIINMCRSKPSECR